MTRPEIEEALRLADNLAAYGSESFTDDALRQIARALLAVEMRDKMRDDGERHLLAEVEARDAEIERLQKIVDAARWYLDSISHRHEESALRLLREAFKEISDDA